MKQTMAEDKYGLVYIIFVLLGVAVLLPFDCLITEAEFYSVRLHQEPFTPAIADNFLNIFGLTYNGASLLALVFLVGLQRYLPTRVQIGHPLWLMLTVLIATALMSLKLDVSGVTMAGFTLPSLALLGMASSMLQGGALTLASFFSPIYIQGCMCGVALGGVATSLLSLLSQLKAQLTDVTPTAKDVAPAAFLFFSASALVVGLCIFAFYMLGRLEFARLKLKVARPSTPDALEPLLPDEEAILADVASTSIPASGREAPPVLQLAPASTQRPHMGGPTAHHPAKLKFAIYCISIMCCLTVTMTAFPGITAFVCSVFNPATTTPCAPSTPYGRLYGDLFVPVTFFVYNLGDLSGRILSGYGPWSRTAPDAMVLLMYSLLRGALVLGLLFCHVVTPAPWGLPTLFNNDLYPLVFTCALGLTQGHLLSTGCMHAPSSLPPEDGNKYGPIMTFCIVFGCLMGSMISIMVVSAIQGLHLTPV